MRGGVERVSLVRVARGAIVAGALGALALGAFACVDNTVVPPSNDVDSAFPGFDGGEDSAAVDTGTDAPVDASVDAKVIDSSAPVDATTDAGKDATVAPSQLGLVAGGTVSHSPKYTMTGTSGPATAPVLRSTHYQLVGGMAVTSQKP
jgi:hypothetical protein